VEVAAGHVEVARVVVVVVRVEEHREAVEVLEGLDQWEAAHPLVLSRRPCAVSSEVTQCRQRSHNTRH